MNYEEGRGPKLISSGEATFKLWCVFVTSAKKTFTNSQFSNKQISQFSWWNCFRCFRSPKITFWKNCAFPSMVLNFHLEFEIQDQMNQSSKRFKRSFKSKIKTWVPPDQNYPFISLLTFSFTKTFFYTLLYNYPFFFISQEDINFYNITIS